MKRIIGVTAIALLMGTAMAAAQSTQVPPSGGANGNASRADQRAGTVVSPQSAPESTNRNQDKGVHEDRLPGGGTTGPVSPSANGG